MWLEFGHQITGPGRVGQGLAREDAHEALPLGGRKHVQGEPRGCPAQLVDPQVLRGARYDHRRGRLGVPAEGRGPGSDGLVGLGPDHRVDDRRFDARVPRPPCLRGAGVDRGCHERDLPGVVHYPQQQRLPVSARQQELDLLLDHIGGGAHQVDGLSQGDASRERPGSGIEDRLE